MLGSAGVTPIDTRVAAVTVSVVEPDTAPEVAVIVVEPTPPAVARPSEPGASEIVAAPVSDEDQTTDVVRSWVEASVNEPGGATCSGVALTMLGAAGVTPIDARVAAVTVSVVDPEITPRVAVIVVEPRPPAVARPSEPAAPEIVATAVSDEDQATDAVRSWVEASVN